MKWTSFSFSRADILMVEDLKDDNVTYVMVSRE